jgi:glucose/mannose transport system permease protein
MAVDTSHNTRDIAAKRAAHSARRRRISRTIERHMPKLLIAPWTILVLIFVYGFIGFTVVVSISKWNSFGENLHQRSPWYETYKQLFLDSRFQADLRNLFIFTVLFLFVGTMMGLLLAILVHNVVMARGFFRSVFLFPYALSFIVSGVVWRWLFNPETGVNLLFKVTGVNSALHAAGLKPLHPGWTTDPTVVGSLNGALAKVFPPLKEIGAQLGIPLALIPIVIAATWQLGGFAMAMFLAGLSTVPEEVIEAAKCDGATTVQAYRRIVIPMLRPTLVATLVIFGYTSLKIFDLVFALSGSGPGFSTDVPGIFVYDETFRAFQYNTGAAASVVMLVLVVAVVIPYLARTYRGQEGDAT